VNSTFQKGVRGKVMGALTVFCLLTSSFSHSSPALANGQLLSVSPDGLFELRRLPAEPGERGEARKELEITLQGRVIYRWTSAIGATSLFWSTDSRYLAINEAPGDRGDQLRLLALDAVKSSVTPLREPNGIKLRSEVESRHGSFLSRVDRVSLRAMDWREGRLWCKVSGIFTPKRQSGVHVPFHHLWVLQVNGAADPVLTEEWTLSDPKEQAYRDSGSQ
jgi:hypothetical protein